MAIKFQYNKTSLTELGKQLKVRQRALPTLQNKESALRLEVRKAKADSDRLIAELEDALKRYDYLAALWNEFEPGLISITDVDLYTKKVAGVKTPALGEIHYEIKPFNAFVKPARSFTEYISIYALVYSEGRRANKLLMSPVFP